VLGRDAIPAELGQREQLAAWEAALAGSGLPLAGLDAARPRPRFAPAAPLAAAIPGEAELMDVWLVERLPTWRVREALQACTPAGWRLVALYDVWLGEAALPGRVAASVYRAAFAAGEIDGARLEEAAASLLAASTLPRERRKGEAIVGYDLRPFLEGIEVTADEAGGELLRMTLRHDPEKGIGRPEEVLAALGERAAVALRPVRLVRERLVLGEPSPPAPPAPRRRPPPGPGGSRARPGGSPPIGRSGPGAR
jgi:radical SAM-linked protein